ncbi:hypothetical protein [Aerosakkonema funiforme]|uniref:hypothetical protein n=1 Tax=Aerosakkonema funiforme TaxID=1246630 RepID=UPI0035BBBC5C
MWIITGDRALLSSGLALQLDLRIIRAANGDRTGLALNGTSGEEESRKARSWIGCYLRG